jgi:hypothetical protein
MLSYLQVTLSFQISDLFVGDEGTADMVLQRTTSEHASS